MNSMLRPLLSRIWQKFLDTARSEKKIRDLEQKYQDLEQKYQDLLKKKVPYTAKSVAEGCFSMPYAGDAASKLRKRLTERLKASDIVYSNTVVLVNSSGMGKSRALWELGNKEGVFIFYCSLAPTPSTVHPGRTPCLADHFEGDDASERRMLNYLLAWLNELKTFIDKGNGDIAELTKKWSKYHHEVVGNFADLNWDSQAEDRGQLRKKIDEILQSLQVDESSGIRFAFVIDEAQRMSKNAFLNVRRAAMGLGRCAAVVLSGTAARVSVLAPPSELEDSARAQQSPTMHPICFVDTVDMHLRKLEGMWDCSEEETWARAKNAGVWLTNAERWSRYGRPLWGCVYTSKHDSAQLLKFAQIKLLHSNCGKISREAGISLLCLTVGLEIHPLSNLAERLTGSHMRVLACISRSRRVLWTVAPVEPVLSIAASNLMRHPKSLLEALRHLNSSTRIDFLSMARGDRCELITKILIMLAFWKCQKDDPVGMVRTEIFLSALMGGTVQLPDALKDSFVWFHRIICLDHNPSQLALLEHLKRGNVLAGTAANSNRAADIFVPLWCMKDKSLAMQQENISFLAVSVKVEDQVDIPSYKKSCTARKLGINIPDDLPYITIMHSVSTKRVGGPVGSRIKECFKKLPLDNEDDKQREAYVMYGIERAELKTHYGQDVLDELSKILAKDNPLAGASEEDKESYQGYSPWMFRDFLPPEYKAVFEQVKKGPASK